MADKRSHVAEGEEARPRKRTKRVISPAERDFSAGMKQAAKQFRAMRETHDGVVAANQELTQAVKRGLQATASLTREHDELKRELAAKDDVIKEQQMAAAEAAAEAARLRQEIDALRSAAPGGENGEVVRLRQQLWQQRQDLETVGRLKEEAEQDRDFQRENYRHACSRNDALRAEVTRLWQYGKGQGPPAQSHRY